MPIPLPVIQPQLYCLMNGVTRRLVVIPGITHLLEVVSILQSETNSDRVYEDYLIFAQFCIFNKSKLIHSESNCIEISNEIHKWKKVISLNNEEEKLLSLPPQKAKKFIYKKIGLKPKEVDKIFIVRNFQPVNKLIVDSYFLSKIVIYGDLGIFDSAIPDNEAERYEIHLSMPIRTKNLVDFSLVPVELIRNNFKKSIPKVQVILHKYYPIIEKFNQKNKILLLTSNHTESSLIGNFDKEIEYYFEVIKKFINFDTVIFIKGHPRESLNQSQILAEKIRKELKLECIVFDETVTFIPSEFFLSIFKFNRVISLISSTCIYAKFLLGVDTTIGVDKHIIKKYFNPKHQNYLLCFLDFLHTFYLFLSENKKLTKDNVFEYKCDYDDTTNSPLIKGGKVKLLNVIKTQEIVNIYKNSFNLPVERFFEGKEEIYVFECTKTKYKFYYPFDIAGDSSFYEYLQQYDWYYMPWKWEHQKVYERIKSCASNLKILEIGCARGSFLERLSQEGYECIGLELNEKAQNEAMERGIKVLSETIQEHASKYNDYYDIVCSFQVMEHIPNIGDVIEASIKTLKKGGRLFISVPNNASFLCLDEKNPLNMPPHHMGLWDETSLKNIAPIFGLKLNAVYLEPLQSYHKGYFKSVINNLLESQYYYYKNKYKIIGRIYFKLHKKHIIKQSIYKQYPQIENFTIIAEYTKL